MLQQTDILRHPVRTLSHTAQGVQNAAVQLARVSLAADRETLRKTEIICNSTVQAVDFFFIAFEQFQKTCLGSGCPAAAEKTHVLKDKIEFIQIGNEILHPERRALADRYRLCRLIVRIPESRRRFIAFGKQGKIFQELQEFPAKIPQPFAEKDEVTVIGDVTACRAEVDDSLRRRRGFSVCGDMRHHVMPYFLLTFGGIGKVDIGDMRFQFRNLFR